MTKVKAALSAAEWANSKGVYRESGDFTLILSCDPPHFVDVAYPDGIREVSIRVHQADLPALAALCMDGQDFGFTWGDVRRHKASADDCRAYPHLEDVAVWHESMAERLKALLRPEAVPLYTKNVTEP